MKNREMQLAISDFENNYTEINDLVRTYNVSRDMLVSELERLGYVITKKSAKDIITIKKAIDEYEEILNSGNQPNINRLSQKYGISHPTIKKYVLSRGLELIKYPKVIQFNEHVFDVIDTEEKAYWLGFLTADGSISTKKNTVSLSLTPSDIEHVRKYAKFLGCENNVRFKNDKKGGMVTCTVGNRHLKETLQKYGFTPDKSYDAIFVDLNTFTDKSLVFHYIRGIMDGDGCISMHKMIRSTKIEYMKTVNCIGTRSIIENILKYTEVTHIKIIQTAELTYAFWISGIPAQKMLDKIYGNCNIYLNRKYELYKLAPYLSESDMEKLRKNGEVCDDNTVVTEEIKESSEL